METYGVSFGGFEPWCGKDLYDDIIKAKIPAAEEALATGKKDLAELQQALRSVEELRKPMLGIKDLAEKTETIIRSSVIAENCCMNRLLKNGKEDARQLLKSFQGFHAWLKDNCFSACECLQDLYGWLEELVSHDCNLYVGLVGEMTVKKDFWTLVAETAKIDHVYEHADSKYRVKICRDAVRDLTLLLEKGRAYEKWLGNSHIPYSEEEVARQIKNVHEIMTQTQNTLARYKKLRGNVKK